jgi:chitodextrinase
MRTSIEVLFAALLAVAVAAPVAAATQGSSTQETISGILEVVHVDEFASGREREDYALRTPGGVIPLEFADSGPGGHGGDTVTVTGTRVDGSLHVGSSRSASTFRVTQESTAATTSATTAATTRATTTATAASPVAKSVAVVLVNFTNLPTQPFTKSAVQAALTGASRSLKGFFEEESKGRMTVTGAVYGWYTINAVTTGCDWRTWHTLGWNAAAASGVDLAGFTNVMFIWPATSDCQFAGLGYVPGKSTYLNGTISVQVMTHEVGHNFGLGHANARRCVVDGVPVTLADDASCTTWTYADPFSTMGNNALRHNHASQLGELGWLEPGEKVVGSVGNTYTITPYFGPPGVKLVRIPRGNGSFFDLDVRSSYGSFDTFAAGSPAVSGVTIRLGLGTASPTGTPKGTELLDTTPATQDLADAPLLVGRTMTDPVSGISFTTLSVSSAGVVVLVGDGAVPPEPPPEPPNPPQPADLLAPSTPGPITATSATTTVALAWGPAVDDVGVTGYLVTRNGVAVTTAAGVTWTDTGRAPRTTYTYTVSAVDTVGHTSEPAAVAATTTRDTARPTAPRSLRRVSRSGSYVTFAWAAASDNVRVTRYYVYKVGRSTPVASTTATRIRIYTVARASYYVRAADAAGNRSYMSVRVRGR